MLLLCCFLDMGEVTSGEHKVERVEHVATDATVVSVGGGAVD